MKTILTALALMLTAAAAGAGQMTLLGAGKVASGAPSPGTIFAANPPLDANDQNDSISFRVAVTLAAASTGTVKVTLLPGTTGSLEIAHASICKAAVPPNCTTAPVELTFAGASGFSGATTAQTSDAINHSGSFALASGDTAIVIFDITTPVTALGSTRINTAALAAVTYWQGAGAQSWNQQNVSGYNVLSPYNYAVSLIAAQ